MDFTEIRAMTQCTLHRVRFLVFFLNGWQEEEDIFFESFFSVKLIS